MFGVCWAALLENPQTLKISPKETYCLLPLKILGPPRQNFEIKRGAEISKQQVKFSAGLVNSYFKQLRFQALNVGLRCILAGAASLLKLRYCLLDFFYAIQHFH